MQRDKQSKRSSHPNGFARTTSKPLPRYRARSEALAFPVQARHRGRRAADADPPSPSPQSSRICCSASSPSICTITMSRQTTSYGRPWSTLERQADTAVDPSSASSISASCTPHRISMRCSSRLLVLSSSTTSTLGAAAPLHHEEREVPHCKAPAPSTPPPLAKSVAAEPCAGACLVLCGVGDGNDAPDEIAGALSVDKCG
mmetsp:Transcript_29546/g.96547  ORF Transcript_29546/g.96547 Transcript_29546/m.96547 type:complete len:201 (-) Transcript_29546:1623-2225(-)